MSNPNDMIARLKKNVRTFWGENEAKFKKVWAVLDKEGKTKFATACVQACHKICPQTEYLLPEISVDKFVNEEEHLSQLFWYYYTNDGVERDEDLVDDLIEAEVLKMPKKQACAVRQMAIMTVLSRSIDVYHAVWSKGTQAAQRDPTVTKEVLQSQAASLANDTCIKCSKPATALCARCEKVKYCSRECQKVHWKTHKAHCIPTNKVKKDDDKTLMKKKLAQAKKNAQDRADNY